MDYKALAEKIFPNITKTPEDIVALYPKRALPEGAKVTRMGPSPTGFVHLGNLYGALVDERLAHQSGGVFYLRIEDTDKKREVPGGAEMIIDLFEKFGIKFDEGVTKDGEKGDYGPYRQSQRAEIYQTFVKHLLSQGMAYPCFCTEEELAAIHEEQVKNKENFGYYGKYAVWRDRDISEIEKKLEENAPFVIRFRSNGSIENKIIHDDLIKGRMELTENDQDVVILKSDGIPTYHFAHVIDDYLMGTTVVVRGEEWLATLPVHLQLYKALSLKPPKYAHTAHLMKMEGGSKRKLSKRKDPELSLSYYYETGYPAASVTEYLMTLLNSNYEEWHRANPEKSYKDFPFSIKKMGASGALFDMEKLNDVSKNVIAAMTADEVYDLFEDWSRNFDPEFHAVASKDPSYIKALLNIGRGGKKPRKDITLLSDIKDYIGFCFDEFFSPDYSLFENFNKEDSVGILKEFSGMFSEEDTPEEFFEKVKVLASKFGYAPETKLYKQNPDAYKGPVGDVSMIIRIAISGRQNSPDLQSVMSIMGKQRVLSRIQKAIDAIS